MKKLLAILLISMMMLGSIAAYAENADAPVGMDGGEGTPPELPEGMDQPEGAGGGPGGGSQSENSGTGTTTLTTDEAAIDAVYTSEAADENALRAENGAVVSIENITVEKSGDTSDNDDSSFYGMNAGVLVRDGAALTISGGGITTSGSGSSGVFAYGTGVAEVSDLIIRTNGNTAGGVMLAGGGTLMASDLDIETQGGSSAAIRTDRGGGTMTVAGGLYVTNGIGSPAVYSTAVVRVSDATLNANNSEAVVVEGKNSVALINCEITGNMTSSAGGSGENLQNVLIYQSMSGDADVGRSDFSMTGGSLTSLSGDTFYVTNTSCTIELDGVAITGADGVLLKVAGNTSSRGWGKEGANGGICDMTVNDQVLNGEIVVDEISSLNLTLNGNSSLTGTVNADGDAGQVSVALNDASIWNLTADAYITSFEGDLENVYTDGFTLYVGGELTK